jgi:3-oxoacyl-(acyl-carrier-protein) synthase
MSINTPIGDTIETFTDALIAGRSAITNWKMVDTAETYSKIGGDLSEYSVETKLAGLSTEIPEDVHRRLTKLESRAAWSTRLSMLLAVDAMRDASLFDKELGTASVAVIVAGHNINSRYHLENFREFQEEPDFIESMYSVHGLDTDHAGCVSEVLQAHGPIYTVGGACSSGNLALRCALDEVRHHGVDIAVVLGAVFDFSAVDLHAMALMGAISTSSFNDAPSQASRPFDTRREGFVPCHGGGCLVLERVDRAMARGARIYAEVLGVEASADANRLPQPSAEGQAKLMATVLERCSIRPEDIDYVNAHATSTPLGDITEIRSLKQVFGPHARRLRINATKSLLGHTMWAAPVVETVASIAQMSTGKLHPSVNVDVIDAEIDLDVCPNVAVEHEINLLMKNSFGFGGINCVSLIRRFEPGQSAR